MQSCLEILGSLGSNLIDILAKVNKFIKILQSGSSTRVLLQYKVAAGGEHADLLKELATRGVRTVVDVGANRGQFTLIARQHFAKAKIFSFEPLREPAAVFRRIFASDPNVILHELALGPEGKDMAIHVSRADDSSSLLPIGSLQNRLFPGTEEKEERMVAVQRLDSILGSEDIQQPALLKIDVQGFERDVLEGCGSLLPRFSHVYVECSFLELYAGQALADEVILFLRSYGFILTGIYNLSYDKKGIAIQGDFLFERRN